MATWDAGSVLKDGFDKIRYCRLDDKKKLNAQSFDTYYKQWKSNLPAPNVPEKSDLVQKLKSNIAKISFEDKSLRHFVEQYNIKHNTNIDPVIAKRLVSGAVLTYGVAMAAFAIKQLVMGDQELKNIYALSDTTQKSERDHLQGITNHVITLIHLKQVYNLQHH